MILIRNSQMAVLREAARQGFKTRAALALRSAFAAQTQGLADAELEAVIACGIEKASSHGIDQQPDVVRFVEYMLCYGRDFDDDDELSFVREILADHRLSGTRKMDAIDRCDAALAEHGI
ncbi:hypothetical protein ACSFBF_22695 [Variovorax sp. ZT5P49]|uniref:hypothetical protein n=1 Tax=Variovorax sp. ZT5P49 TaxID=3443733 RepID=UPI003F48ABB4